MHVNTENSNKTMSYNFSLSLLSLATGNPPYIARYPRKLTVYYALLFRRKSKHKQLRKFQKFLRVV